MRASNASTVLRALRCVSSCVEAPSVLLCKRALRAEAEEERLLVSLAEFDAALDAFRDVLFAGRSLPSNFHRDGCCFERRRFDWCSRVPRRGAGELLLSSFDVEL